MISPHDLQYFHVLSSTKNLRQASAQLHVTQPALSHSIKRLEDQLGFPLFDRTKTGLRLTNSGRTLLEKTSGLLQQWNEIPSLLAQEENSLRGKVRLGMHPSVGAYSLGRFLPELQAKFPDLEFGLTLDLSRNITQAVIDSRVDIGIVVNPINHPELVIREIGKDDVTFFKVSAKSFDGGVSDVLVYDSSLSQSQWLIGKLGKKQQQFRRHFNVTDLNVILHLTASGAGIGILPERVANMAPEPLIRWSSDAPIYQDKICVVYRAIQRKSNIGKLVIDSILDAKI